MLKLRGGDAEIWAWERTVTGTLQHAERCQAIVVQVNDNRVAATVDGDGFSAMVPIAPGPNTITTFCQYGDGQTTSSPAITYTGMLKQQPTARITLSLKDGRIIADGGQSTADSLSAAPIVEYTWAVRSSNPTPLSIVNNGSEQPLGSEATGGQLIIAPPAADGEYYLSLRVVDAEGREDASTTYFVVSSGQPRIPDYAHENTAWVESAIVYGVIPGKFGDPAFQGIVEKLDYLKDLGINALWLSPINKSPHGDFGYAVVDYFAVNPDYGTKDDFKTVVQEAHARGIRVLLDFVPNHTSAEHPYFQDAQANGTESPYYNFYDRDKSGAPTYYFDWKHLPNLNYSNPEVERFMLEAFSYWVREFDVDGFRVDACWGVKERKPDFWPRWRAELQRIKPDLLLLAEASARDAYYFTDGFDAAYDWTAQLGKWAWQIVWDSRTLLIYNLNAALTNNGQGFHPDALIFRFLNNNDTGTRFITTYGEDMTRVAAALLLTLPGIPCVYTGDEIGAWFRPYTDTLPLVWKEKYPGLRDYYKKLIALRNDQPGLRSRLWQPLEAEPRQQVYGYLRYTAPEATPLLVLLNFSDQPVEAEVALPAPFAKFGQSATLKDVLMDEQMTLAGAAPLKISMPAWAARVLINEETA